VNLRSLLSDRYARSRARIVVGVGLLAVAWALVQRLPERSTAGVAALIGEGSSAVVAEDDFVWEPSGGALRDLVFGRRVLFLGRREADAPRDLHRARVHTTPGGQPLFARSFEQLTDTRLGDERGLVAQAGRAAFLTVWRDRVQSVGVVDLGGGEVRRAAMSRPSDRVEIEIAEDALVLALPDGAALLPWHEGEARSSSSVAIAWVPGGVAPAPTDPAPAALDVAPPDQPAPPDRFPPSGFVPLDPRASNAAVYERTDGEERLWALDGRQLEFFVVPGFGEPGSETGFVADGSLPAAIPRDDVVAVFSLPVGGSRRAGFQWGESWMGPIERDAPALASTQARELTLGRWGLDPFEARAVAAASELGSVASGASWLICATDAGHLVLGTGGATTVGARCAARATGGGAIEIVRDAVEGDRARPQARAMLVATRSRYGPDRPPASGAWEPLAAGQPDPAWLPAVRRATVPQLGTDVDVTWIDARRFDWVILAGERERGHRFGGDFPEVLPEADRDRARFAIGIGVGKRKAPRGLRIGGSTGLRFRGHEGLLVVGEGRMVIQGAERPEVEPQADGTELAVSVEEGRLAPGARVRGPRQLRADLCVLGGGTALMSQAIFDSHEATAAALIELGCRRAVSLDRGSEHATWMRTKEPGPFTTTSLVALERPMRGRVSTGFDEPPM
jgi:hypothetical protein